MSASESFADVVEGVRATLAAYTQALDDGRTEEVVATFLPDGTCTIPGVGLLAGHEALRKAYANWLPRRPQRHLVLNTLVTSWSDIEAKATSDIVFIQLGKTDWSIQLVGRYDDVLRNDHGTWRFQSRVATFITPAATP